MPGIIKMKCLVCIAHCLEIFCRTRQFLVHCFFVTSVLRGTKPVKDNDFRTQWLEASLRVTQETKENKMRTQWIQIQITTQEIFPQGLLQRTYKLDSLEAKHHTVRGAIPARASSSAPHASSSASEQHSSVFYDQHKVRCECLCRPQANYSPEQR